MREKKGQNPRIRLGQRVMIPSVGGSTLAEIVEDRGFVGAGGRHIVTIRTLEDLEEVRRTFEVPVERITFVE
jgi:hypothetical protein